jgi:hypothetical protein
MTVLEAAVARCTFCTKDNSEVDKMIAGAGVFICSECVSLCEEILNDPTIAPAGSSLLRWEEMSDEEILDLLPRIASVATQVEDNLLGWVKRLRSRGVTWARIGGALGMAKQSAWERFAGDE